MGTGSAQTELEGIGSQSDMDHGVGVNQRGGGGMDRTNIDQSGKEADPVHQRDGRGDTVGVENGRTGAGGVGVDLDKNGSGVCLDRADGRGSGQVLGVGAKNSEADGMDIDQSVSGAHVDKDGSEEDRRIGVDSGSGGGAMDVDQSGGGVDRGVGVVGQGDEVRGGADVGPSGDRDRSSSEDELTSSTSEAEESEVIRSTRKRKTPPSPEPASKDGKRKAPRNLKKPVRKLPKAKPEPTPESKLQSRPPRSQKASTRTYFEEIETKGPQGSQLKIVEIIDLTQVWVCPFFPAKPFPLLICPVERAS